MNIVTHSKSDTDGKINIKFTISLLIIVVTKCIVNNSIRHMQIFYLHLNFYSIKKMYTGTFNSFKYFKCRYTIK